MLNIEKITATATGNHEHGNCKPVICATTMVVYKSLADAAAHNEVTVASLGNHCRNHGRPVNGKQYYYLKDFEENLPELLNSMRTVAENRNAAVARKQQKFLAKKETVSRITEELNKQKVVCNQLEEELRKSMEELEEILKNL